MSALILWNLAWSAALAVVVFGLGHLPALQRRPALMHLLWFGVLLRLVVPAFIAIPILPDTTATVRIEADFTQAVPQNVSVEIVPISETPLPVEPVAAPAASWTPRVTLSQIMFFMSVAGTVVLLLLTWLRCRWLHRLQRAAHVAPQPLHDLAARLAREMNLAAVPQLRVVEGLASPSLWGLGRRTTILLPRHLVDEFDADQWTCVLAHELAHVLRGDVWFNLIAAVVLHLCWWNPIAWWAYREMRASQEASCDAIALAGSSPSRRQYAETLLQVVDSWTRPSLVQPQVLLGFGNRSVLTRRFEMIADSSVRPRAAALVTLCLAVLALTFCCVPMKAEKEEPAAANKELAAEKDPKNSTTEENARKDDEKTAKLDELNQEPIDNIARIMIALHNYRDTFGTFPPAAGYYPGSQHPHSWRVAILPWLDQAPLYNRYNFKEPWDSPANKKILAKMPAVFRDPRDNSNSINSSYFVFAEKVIGGAAGHSKLPTLFSGNRGMRTESVTDGLSNTLAIVETRRDVPWTKPEDIDYDPAEKLPELGGIYKDAFRVGMSDGAIRVVSTKAKEDFIRAIISPAGGEIVDHDDFVLTYRPGDKDREADVSREVSPAGGSKDAASLILKYDDGKPDGKKSIAGTGEMIHFTAPDANHKLKSLRLHCARYGTSKPPNEDVDISILSDDEQTVLHTEMVPYSRFKRGESRWTPIEFKTPVEVPEKFWIVVDFNAEQTKGVYLSYDTSTEGQHSKTGVPGGESKPVTTGGDWMIQAVLTTK